MGSTDIANSGPDDGLFEISRSFEQVNDRNRQLGWNVQYLQLKPAEYRGRLAGMDVGDTTLLIEDVDIPSEILGEFDADSVAILFASAPAGSDVYVQNQDFCSSAFLLNCGGEINIITGKDTKVGQLYMNGEVFYRFWEMLAPGVDPFKQGYYGFIGLPPGFGQACYRDIQRIIQGGYATQPEKEEYAYSVLALLASQALSKSSHREQRLQTAARARSLSRSRDYIESKRGMPIKLPELCHYVGVSISTLNRIFREYYGMSPAAYIRLRRMHYCQQYLQMMDPAEKSVGEVMRACGVKHPGRFSKDYRVFFGESPKQTLGYIAR